MKRQVCRHIAYMRMARFPTNSCDSWWGWFSMLVWFSLIKWKSQITLARKSTHCNPLALCELLSRKYKPFFQIDARPHPSLACIKFSLKKSIWNLCKSLSITLSIYTLTNKMWTLQRSFQIRSKSWQGFERIFFPPKASLGKRNKFEAHFYTPTGQFHNFLNGSPLAGRSFATLNSYHTWIGAVEFSKRRSFQRFLLVEPRPFVIPHMAVSCVWPKSWEHKICTN